MAAAHTSMAATAPFPSTLLCSSYLYPAWIGFSLRFDPLTRFLWTDVWCGWCRSVCSTTHGKKKLGKWNWINWISFNLSGSVASPLWSCLLMTLNLKAPWVVHSSVDIFIIIWYDIWVMHDSGGCTAIPWCVTQAWKLQPITWSPLIIKATKKKDRSLNTKLGEAKTSKLKPLFSSPIITKHKSVGLISPNWFN